MLVRIGMRCALMAALVLGAASVASAADDGVWSVSKSSGEVWLATSGAQQVSLNQEETLKPGDTIRTGRNGRVLLVRGEETILISPNSVVGVPAEKKVGLSTTIVQQAGSILLSAEVPEACAAVCGANSPRCDPCQNCRDPWRSVLPDCSP